MGEGETLENNNYCIVFRRLECLLDSAIFRFKSRKNSFLSGLALATRINFTLLNKNEIHFFVVIRLI
jgi:hypothetical protein